MPVNAHPEYIAAERDYLYAKTLEEKIDCLKKMISLVPKHKSAENLRAQLRLRLKKFLEKEEKGKKGKSGPSGIKKEDMQVMIVGFTNTGKSTLLSKLTNATPIISDVRFTTSKPVVGILDYQEVGIQLIENPAIESEYYDKGLTNTADVVLILVRDIDEIEKIKSHIEKSVGKQIIVFNKMGEEKDMRKISSTLSSKKYNFVIISTETGEGLEELKEKIFQNFNKLRIYTKEPGKEKSQKPIILNPGSIVKDVAEKISKGFSEKIKETKIWGPSSKFPGQKVGLKHILKDKDIVEFKTK